MCLISYNVVYMTSMIILKKIKSEHTDLEFKSRKRYERLDFFVIYYYIAHKIHIAVKNESCIELKLIIISHVND